MIILLGIAYIGILYTITTLYLPCAQIAVVYAIAGIGYAVAKQVSLTVEKVRSARYNISMRTRAEVLGLTSAEAFRALQAGNTVYIVALEPNSERVAEYSPIGQGAWSDEAGRLYIEPCLITTSAELAQSIAFAERQKCILRLIPDWAGDARVYLYTDTPSNRAYSLANAGGYTAIEGNILTFAEHFLPHYLAEGEVEFLFVKGDYIPIRE